jgi:hypothetical protein
VLAGGVGVFFVVGVDVLAGGLAGLSIGFGPAAAIAGNTSISKPVATRRRYTRNRISAMIQQIRRSRKVRAPDTPSG